MQPAPGHGDGPEQPGLDQVAASYAVLGVDVESFGFAVARHWGLGDEILHMIRRLPVDAPVRKPDGDADLLRIVASAANEIVDVASDVPREEGGGRARQRDAALRPGAASSTPAPSSMPCRRRRTYCARALPRRPGGAMPHRAVDAVEAAARRRLPPIRVDLAARARGRKVLCTPRRQS